MPTVPEDDDLWNEAMALLLAWQAAPQDERAREAIRAFCARGPDHHSAWEEAKRVYRVTGDAVGARPRRGGPSRRQVVTGVAAIAAGAAAALQAPGLMRRWRADEVTGVGEIRRFALPDGSWMTLGPESAVSVAFSRTERRVLLDDGMALCEVRAEGDRPFIAEAGALTASTDAGAFEVRHEGARSFVASQSGRIEAVVGPAGTIALAPGEWVSLGPQEGAVQRGRRDAKQIAAWRERLLIADRENVATIVAEIVRWQRGRVIIPEAALADASVSGLFDLSDPPAALAAVVAPYGGKVRQVLPWLTVLTTL